MKLEKPIASGRTADVYPWERNKVLKLFYKSFPDRHVKHEAKLARAVQAAGLPVPAVAEVLEVNGRMGIEYERIDGVTLAEEMRTRPWRIPRLSHLLALLQVRLHEVREIHGVPSQRERLEQKILGASGLSADLQHRAIQVLQAMPEDNRLCHGDFHPGNVILSSRGPVIIDWIDATLGNPLADVGRTTLLVHGELAPGQTLSWLAKIGLRLAHREYIKRYFQEQPGCREEYHRWRPLVAAGRMNEGIEELEDWLRTQVEAGFGSSPKGARKT